MPTTDRRSALASLAGGLLGALALRRAGAAERKPVRDAWELLFTGQPVRIRVESAPVRWRNNDYRLVRIGKAAFSRGPAGRVTGTLTAGVTTFDNVEYDVHVALFDEAGTLLGTAKTPCPVSRIWLGKTLIESRELPLDFGISRTYERAKWFTVAITEREVLTPDQWQKG